MAIPVGTAVGYLDLDYSKFSKKLDTAITEANGLSQKFSDTIGSGLTTIGDKISSVGTKLTTGISVPLGIATVSAVKFGAEFDKGMSNVKAVSGATAEEFEAMRDAAIDWGEKTVYTAAEATDALYYMGLAGWDAKESLAGLGPVLNLAAAGNLELGRTSDIVTDGMTAMQVAADGLTNGINNTTHFTNVLAATMSNSNTDVDQLGEAFKYVAPLAGAAGMEIDDLGLALGLMADVGVKASQAGTGLRQALKNVISPTDKMQAAMDKFGVSLFDAEGNAKSMRQFMEELRETFGELAVDIYDANGELKTAEDIMAEYGHSLPTTQQEKLNAIVEIFGTRALPGVLGIIEQSDERFDKLASAIDGSDKAFVRFGGELMTYQEAVEQFGEELVNTSKDFEVLGYAEGMAQVQMDNLQGDWIRFQSALGTTKIEVTDLVNGALRELVQRLTQLVTWFNDLDDEQQKNILRWAAIIAAAGPALLVFGKMVTGVGNLIKAFNEIGGAITKLKVGFGMISNLNNTTMAFTNLFRVLGPFKGTLALIKGALMALVSPLGLVISVATLLASCFVHLMKTNEQFRERILGIWDGIKVKFEEAGQKILDVINKIGFDFSSLKEVASTVFDALSKILGPALIGMFENLAEVITSLVDIFTGVFEIIGGIIIGFKDGDWSTFTQGLTDFFGGLLDLMEAPFKFIINILTEYLHSFGITWSDIWNKASEIFHNVVNSISEGVTNLINSFIEWKNGVEQEFIEFHTNLWDSIANFFIEIFTSITTFIEDVKTSVKDFIDGLLRSIIELFVNIVLHIASFIISMVEKLEEIKEKVKEALIFIFNNVKSKVLDIVNDITNKFNQIKDFLKNVLTIILNLFINRFTEMKNKVIGKVTEIKNGIINIFSDIRQKFSQIGSNIINGIWDGISAGWDWLTGKVRDLANSLFEAAKSALDISSPSGVFRDGFGYWIPMGAAEGVEKAMPKAVDEIQEAFDDGLSQIDGSVDITTTVDMIDTVQEAINDVAVWFESTEERLRSIVEMMRDDLLDLISINDSLVTPEGIIIESPTTKPSDSLDVKRFDENGETTGSGTVINNYSYTFNSPKAIDEIEASRQMKNTQRDLAEGF